MVFISGILLGLHLLCMNISSAGPLLCIWLNRRSSSEDEKALGLRLAWDSFSLLIVGICLGLLIGAIGYLSGSVNWAGGLSLMRYKVTWGIAEIACSLAWNFGYWAWMKYRPPVTWLAGMAHAGLALLSATNLLYHFPPLMTIMAKVAHGEIALSEPIDASSFRTLIFSNEIWAHVFHIWFASIAVSAVYLIWLAENLRTPKVLQVFAARVALVTTLFQFGSGFWLLVALPPKQQSAVMGNNLLATLLLVVGIATGFHLLGQLANLAFGDDEKKLPRRVVYLTALTVILMSYVLQILRT